MIYNPKKKIIRDGVIPENIPSRSILSIASEEPTLADMQNRDETMKTIFTDVDNTTITDDTTGSRTDNLDKAILIGNSAIQLASIWAAANAGKPDTYTPELQKKHFTEREYAPLLSNAIASQQAQAGLQRRKMALSGLNAAERAYIENATTNNFLNNVAATEATAQAKANTEDRAMVSRVEDINAQETNKAKQYNDEVIRRHNAARGQQLSQGLSGLMNNIQVYSQMKKNTVAEEYNSLDTHYQNLMSQLSEDSPYRLTLAQEWNDKRAELDKKYNRK